MVLRHDRINSQYLGNFTMKMRRVRRRIEEKVLMIRGRLDFWKRLRYPKALEQVKELWLIEEFAYVIVK